MDGDANWPDFQAVEARRNAEARVYVSEIRAKEGKTAEAAELLRLAIPEWPDSDRVLPWNKRELKRRLAEYEKK